MNAETLDSLLSQIKDFGIMYTNKEGNISLKPDRIYDIYAAPSLQPEKESGFGMALFVYQEVVDTDQSRENLEELVDQQWVPVGSYNPATQEFDKHIVNI